MHYTRLQQSPLCRIRIALALYTDSPTRTRLHVRARTSSFGLAKRCTLPRRSPARRSCYFLEKPHFPGRLCIRGFGDPRCKHVFISALCNLLTDWTTRAIVETAMRLSCVRSRCWTSSSRSSAALVAMDQASRQKRRMDGTRGLFRGVVIAEVHRDGRSLCRSTAI